MSQRRMRIGALPVVLLCVAALSCGGTSNVPDGIASPDGFVVTSFAEGFRGPTQMVFAENGDLIIAELNGAENDATGRVLRVAGGDLADRVVLQDNLDKPTGIAVTGDSLWIMERQRLSITTLEPGATRTIVVDDLPSNGRSEGTLTVTPEGDLLFDTSGSKRGSERVPGSATLFTIEDPASGGRSANPLATGFKHAYAHVFDGDGQLWSVEMTDGTFDDTRASDELLAVDAGDDAGWPQCVDDNRAVAEFGGTAASCAGSPRSHALFGAGATPTSIVVAPWNPDVFLVALWLPSKVVTVPRPPRGEAPHRPTDFLTGIESPQHLLVDGDRVLVSDHETGAIFAITPVD